MTCGLDPISLQQLLVMGNCQHCGIVAIALGRQLFLDANSNGRLCETESLFAKIMHVTDAKLGGSVHI